ncbi:hypothetical protein GCM10026986_34120 [Nitrincola alkalisediminis]
MGIKIADTANNVAKAGCRWVNDERVECLTKKENKRFSNVIMRVTYVSKVSD